MYTHVYIYIYTYMFVMLSPRQGRVHEGELRQPLHHGQASEVASQPSGQSYYNKI